MAGSITMTDKQKCAAGISILDADGQPYTAKPADATVSFSSGNPEVANFEVGPDGLNGFITSGKVGSASIVASVILPDGTSVSDSISVSVVNSAPGAANFTPGAPVDE